MVICMVFMRGCYHYDHSYECAAINIAEELTVNAPISAGRSGIVAAERSEDVRRLTELIPLRAVLLPIDTIQPSIYMQ